MLFDVDVGPRIDILEPDGVLSDSEQAAISFHAFPDSMSMEVREPCRFSGAPPSSVLGLSVSRWMFDASNLRDGVLGA